MEHILQRFSQNAREALVKSQIIARTEAHAFVATHHLLLALTQQPESLASRVLKDLQVDLPKIAEICNRVIFKQSQETQTQGIEDELRLVIQYAFEEASDLGSSYVGTEHLLLGILELERSLAAQILLNSQVDPEEVRAKIQELSTLVEAPAGLKLDPADASSIEAFGRDLTQEALLGKLDPVIGREPEIARLIQILSRRTKNNPILLGEAGVGKTAIVEGLAQQIVQQNVPASMLGKRIFSLNVGSLVAGTKFRGDFEERMMRILQEIQEQRQTILFIDELHILLGAGSAAGSLDAANMMKPLLAKGEIQTIGATTFDEYQEYIEEDAALSRRFQPIMVEEPSVEQTCQILSHIGKMYEAFHGVRYDQNAYVVAAELAHRYVADRKLPDAAIDLIDEAASRVKIQRTKVNTREANLTSQLAAITADKEQAVTEQQYDKAYTLRQKEQAIKKRLDQYLAKHAQPIRRNLPVVHKEDVAQVIAHWLDIPVTEIDRSEMEKLSRLEEDLHQRIIGQDEAIKLISSALKRTRLGLASAKRPIASFLFLGPSGVGKTETARVLADTVFNGEQNLIKINMSEYMEKYSASNLIGAPAGYIGYEEGGKLTEMVRRRPYSVILFDEIEKAHPDIFNLLLQVLEDGELVDAKGRKVNFRNTIIIFTSNLGAELLSQKGKIGFSFSGSIDELETVQTDQAELHQRLLDNLKQEFRPEFLNRLSGIVVFETLSQDQVKKIAQLMIKDLSQRLKNLKINLKVDPAAYDYLSQNGLNQELGVRPLRRLIEREIEDAITDGLISGKFHHRQSLKVTAKDSHLKVTSR